jgi:6-phosphogluconolactonase
MREIHVSKNTHELVENAAAIFESTAAAAVAERGRFIVSLAGGSTPKQLYSRMVSAKIDWSNTVIIVGDERDVPPESEESNFGMIQKTLLVPAGIGPERVHRWRTELGDPEQTAEDFRRQICALGEAARIDLVLLGLGEDCHTASLFPNTSAISESELPAVANFVPRLGSYRYTITFPVINSAELAAFLVSGEGKAEAVSRVLNAERPDKDVPASLVRPHPGRTIWLLDEAAARISRQP